VNIKMIKSMVKEYSNGNIFILIIGLMVENIGKRESNMAEESLLLVLKGTKENGRVVREKDGLYFSQMQI